MFTGIIEKVAPVLETLGQSELRLSVESSFDGIKLGESIAINGVCLTVIEFTPTRLDFHVSAETLARSNLGRLGPGSLVNLERALLATDRLSGHIVQGHVDGLGEFISATASGESHEVIFKLPSDLARYCVEKGSIAINGTSLTLNAVSENEIKIMLIPHTWRHTNLSALKPGDPVNVEVDIFAKYAMKFTENLCQTPRPHLN